MDARSPGVEARARTEYASLDRHRAADALKSLAAQSGLGIEQVLKLHASDELNIAARMVERRAKYDITPTSAERQALRNKLAALRERRQRSHASSCFADIAPCPECNRPDFGLGGCCEGCGFVAEIWPVP